MGERLGEGATGTVYAALNANGDELAVKFLRESLADDPEVVARFKREASVGSKLRSEFIAQVVGAGRSGQRYWIAYRRLRGETLAVRLRREIVLETAMLVPVIEQVLRGLHVAHEAGVVHRDIKPGNVMLERIEREASKGVTERACLLDFGLSKSPTGSSATSQQGVTSATATLGTVDYMPPEQFGASASVDHRADLYSVGVVAYRALSGRLPSGGKSQASVMYAKLHRDAPSLGETTGTKWPHAVEEFFVQALARDPAARFGNATAMATAWRLALEAPGMPATAVLRRVSGPPEEDERDTLEGPASTR
jgi:serine/threonine-protein kinase